MIDDNNTPDKCDMCFKNRVSEPHECPYFLEIDNDKDFQCTCCDECTEECARNI